jgi:hypothetical protein
VNILDHAAAQLRLSDIWGDIIDLNADYSRSQSPEQRETLAGRIADLHDQAAAVLESSRFVRWVSSGLADAGELRGQAQHWRLHGDPGEANRW